MSSLLAGIRIIDLTNVIAGPLASYYLALVGAEVIKVEVPGVGDLARKMGADPSLGRAKMGVSFLAMNASKKSITLNLKSDEGRAIFEQLVAGADVVIENYKPGTMKRLGFSAERLHAINPRLIFCSVSGFGQTGPIADRPSYDQIIQGYSGLMESTGDADGAPTRAGYVACDTSAAMTAAFAIAAALVRQRQTGQGETIDVSMLDTSLSSMASWNVANYLNAGQPTKRMGNQSHSAAPSGTFTAADGRINIVNNEQKQFEKLCEALDLVPLLQDERFAAPHERFANRLALQEILEKRLGERTVAEWDTALYEAGVPVGPVLSLSDAVDHPQTVFREVTQRFENVPGVGRDVSVPRIGFHLGGKPVEISAPPPQLGQHTDEVLAALGYGQDDITALRQAGAI